jgi:hypothetical protein
MAPPGLGQGDSTRLVLSSRVDAAKPHQQKEDTPMDEQSFQDETPHGQDLEVATDKPRSISEKKLEANRRNAQKSTGPITAEGQKISSMNSLTHGLLARAVPITTGDYREDAVEFQELLDSLWDRFRPVGAAEELEVETIAQCYWKKCRLARWENGVTRRKTLGLRRREENRRDGAFESVLELNGDRWRLEQTTRGIQYIIDLMVEVKQQLQDPDLDTIKVLPEALQEALRWLGAAYPDDFLPAGEIPPENFSSDGQVRTLLLTPVYVQQLTVAIDEHRVRLQALRCKMACAEDQEIEAKIDAAALPIRELEKVVRYGTSNDRELERSFKRLEMLQKVRKASGRIWPSQGA